MMKITIDTFSWKKLDILEENGSIKMEEIVNRCNTYITHAVLEEVNHFNIKLHHPSKVSIIPHKNNMIHEDARAFGFDEADASIVSLGADDEEMVIISEDRPLLTFGKGYNLNIVQLIDFFKVMTVKQIITRNDLFKINKVLRGMKNISKNKEKSVKEWLKSHSSE